MSGYSTKDVELAAFLHASKVKIIDVRKNEANKTIFVFENPDGATQKMSLKFYNHEDEISASRLLSSFQTMRHLIFDPNLERVEQQHGHR